LHVRKLQKELKPGGEPGVGGGALCAVGERGSDKKEDAGQQSINGTAFGRKRSGAAF
jgi:hypothetical protein